MIPGILLLTILLGDSSAVHLHTDAFSTAESLFDNFTEELIIHHGRVFAQVEIWKPFGLTILKDCNLTIA